MFNRHLQPVIKGIPYIDNAIKIGESIRQLIIILYIIIWKVNIIATKL